MNDNRRVRFACIDGIGRAELPLAGEIWLKDVYAAPWATRDAMKLAAHFERYMTTPDPQLMIVNIIEQRIQLPKKEIEFGLKTLQLFGAVKDFAFSRFDLSVALHLTRMQRLRIIEVAQTARNLAPCLLDRTDADAWTPTLPAAGGIEDALIGEEKPQGAGDGTKNPIAA